jgi:hypothetical protein
MTGGTGEIFLRFFYISAEIEVIFLSFKRGFSIMAEIFKFLGIFDVFVTQFSKKWH